MAWTAPMTAVANTVFTAAQFNQSVRDNLLETAPAKATAAGTIFVGTGANAIAERVPTVNRVATSETTTSTSYTDLTTTGPAVTVTTGVRAIVGITARLNTSSATAQAWAGYAVSGASSIAADDAEAILITSGIANESDRQSYVGMLTTLTAGSNTFTMKYKVSAGTGSFSNRQIFVIPL